MSQSTLNSQSAKRLSLLSTAFISGLLAVAAWSNSAPLPMPYLGNGNAASEVETEEINGEAVLAIAIAGSAAIGVGMSAVVDHKRSQPSSYSPARRGTQSATVSLDRVSRSLQHRMIRLLHEDYGAARRLLTYTSLKYPGHDANWYAEKIIYDLERDRGGR